MSIFKEKDDYLSKYFKNLSKENSDDEEPTGNNATFDESQNKLDERDGLPAVKRPKFDSQGDHANDAATADADIPQKEARDVRQGHKDKELPSIEIASDESSEIECIELDDDSNTGDGCIEISDDEPSDQITCRTRSKSALLRTTQKQPPIERRTIIIEEPTTLNKSLDFDDRNFNLKIKLAGSLKQYSTTYKTPLAETLKDLIAKLRSQDRDLVLMLRGQPVHLLETPHSLKLEVITILDAIEVAKDPGAVEYDPDILVLKLQDGHRKHTKEFRIKKDAPLLSLRESYAKEFKIVSIDNIKFLFDGDVIEDGQTPDDLEIEDGCVIDVLVK